MAGWLATRLLSTTCYVIATMHLSSVTQFQTKTNVTVFLYIFLYILYEFLYILYAIEIGRCHETITSLPNEIKMCRICTSNVSCSRGEM